MNGCVDRYDPLVFFGLLKSKSMTGSWTGATTYFPKNLSRSAIVRRRSSLLSSCSFLARSDCANYEDLMLKQLASKGSSSSLLLCFVAVVTLWANESLLSLPALMLVKLLAGTMSRSSQKEYPYGRSKGLQMPCSNTILEVLSWVSAMISSKDALHLVSDLVIKIPRILLFVVIK